MRCKDGWVVSEPGDSTVTFQFLDGMTLVAPLALVRKKDRPLLRKRVQLGGGWTGAAYCFECKIDDAGFICAVSKRIPYGAVFPGERKKALRRTRRMGAAA